MTIDEIPNARLCSVAFWSVCRPIGNKPKIPIRQMAATPNAIVTSISEKLVWRHCNFIVDKSLDLHRARRIESRLYCGCSGLRQCYGSVVRSEERRVGKEGRFG